MDFEAKRLTKAVRGLDPSLFVKRDTTGRLVIYAERLMRPDSPELVVYLTCDWTDKTPAREWGVLPIIAKLQSMKRSPVDVLAECTEHNDRVRNSEKRARTNDTESFLKDYRRQFARTFSDINTSTIRKVDGRRKKEKQYGSR